MSESSKETSGREAPNITDRLYASVFDREYANLSGDTNLLPPLNDKYQKIVHKAVKKLGQHDASIVELKAKLAAAQEAGNETTAEMYKELLTDKLANDFDA